MSNISQKSILGNEGRSAANNSSTGARISVILVDNVSLLQLRGLKLTKDGRLIRLDYVCFRKTARAGALEHNQSQSVRLAFYSFSFVFRVAAVTQPNVLRWGCTRLLDRAKCQVN